MKVSQQQRHQATVQSLKKNNKNDKKMIEMGRYSSRCNYKPALWGSANCLLKEIGLGLCLKWDTASTKCKKKNNKIKMAAGPELRLMEILHELIDSDIILLHVVPNEIRCQCFSYSAEWMSARERERASRMCQVPAIASPLLPLIHVLLLSECCCRSPHIINQLFTSSLLMFNERGCCGQLLMNLVVVWELRGEAQLAELSICIRVHLTCVWSTLEWH